MFTPAFTILIFINFIFCFLFPFSNANPSSDDKKLIAFMRNDQKMQISEYSKQKYESHLGIVYFLRMNWQCDKIDGKFNEYERTECQKYRKYLDILHEYLSMEYIGIPTVKPKFVFKHEIEIEGPIIYALNCLVKISQFYFKSNWSKVYNYKLYIFFRNYFEPKLLNEESLNYGIKLENEPPKMPIDEMILQLAIDTANEWPQTYENIDGFIKQKFDENLEEMYKKAENRQKKDNPSNANLINVDKHLIILDTKFDDKLTWIEDALFSEFVKGLATNFVKYFKKTKEYCIDATDPFRKEYKDHMKQLYEAQLGVAYLMRENWHFEKIGKKMEVKCQKYCKYFDILYEHFFRLYAEAKNPTVLKQLPPLVKPIFIEEHLYCSLIDVVTMLNDNFKFFWQNDANIFHFINDLWEMDLVNEEELNYEINENKSGENASTNETETTTMDKLRKEFERKMKNFCENAKQNAKVDLEKAAKSETDDDEEKAADLLENEYEDNFGTFNSLPLS